jgi:hypothetical protein
MGREIFNGLAVSNIAWEPNQDLEIASLLRQFGVHHIDLAPTKYIQWQSSTAVAELKKIKSFWAQYEIEIRGFQSLLFGRSELNIFRESDWSDLIDHFEHVIELAKICEVTKLVFGSPKNRLKGELPLSVANQIVGSFFTEIDDRLNGSDICLLLEPNPKEYGCDFLTNTIEACEFLANRQFSNIKIQLDLGTCLYNEESPRDLMSKYETSFGYCHLSTIELAPLHEISNRYISEISTLEISFEKAIEMKAVPGKEVENLRLTFDWLEKI